MCLSILFFSFTCTCNLHFVAVHVYIVHVYYIVSTHVLYFPLLISISALRGLQIVVHTVMHSIPGQCNSSH